MLDQLDKQEIPVSEQFNILLEGYQGPIDLLLDLAKRQKVDLSEISILKLAEQYLVYINKYTKIHLEIAADYLVMAAWLTYLKSRILLPKKTAHKKKLVFGTSISERGGLPNGVSEIPWA